MQKMKKLSIPMAILGGGLCGVYLASRLRQLGVPFELFEANGVVGGLARTLQTGMFKWDMGVHALYSKDPKLNRFFQNIPIQHQRSKRNVRICHVRGEQIYELDYPFENGLDALPDDDWEDCIVGYMEARQRRNGPLNGSFKNIEEWIQKDLGYGIERCFMRPYNQKIWNAPLNEISMDLVANKIEPEPFETVLRNALGKKSVESVGRRYQAEFIYPKGGIQELCDHFANRAKNCIKVNKKVVKIQAYDGQHILFFADGSQSRPFKSLVSTIPLKTLIHLLPYSEIHPLADNLKHNSTLFIMIGLKANATFKRFHNCHWIFFAGDEIFYRVTMMHNFSNALPVTAVAEYTIKSRGELDIEWIEYLVVKDLVKRGILRAKEDIAVTNYHIQPYTYPIPTVGLNEIKTVIKNLLQDKAIHLLGRNGNWDYINMDQVIADVDRFLELSHILT